MTDQTPTMPAFVFDRRPNVEREGGYFLAGNLIVDIPRNEKLKKRHQRMINEIVKELCQFARSGQMVNNVVGWHEGSWPANAADLNDDALMSAWAKDRIVIALRVGSHAMMGRCPVDSDLLKQAGLVKHH